MCRMWMILLVVGLSNAQECIMGEWSDWTEWTKLDCGEEASGAAAPTKGKYDEYIGKTNPGIMQDGRAICNQGFAGGWPCANVDQMARFTFTDLCGIKGGFDDCGYKETDMVGKGVTGWVAADGTEYGIMTTNVGTHFIRISADEFNVTIVDAEMLAYMNGGSIATRRDCIVIGNYLYVIADTTGHGMQILDLTVLESIFDVFPDFPLTMLTPNATYNGFGSAISLVASSVPEKLFVTGAEEGILTCGGGLLALDILVPTDPSVLGCYGDNGIINDAHCFDYTGRDDDYYIRNNKTTETCFAFNGLRMLILDVTSSLQMQLISANNYVDRGFAAQGSVENRHIILISGDTEDELNLVDRRTRTYVWDIVDLDAPFRDFTYTAEYAAIDSTQYVQWDQVYQAHYEAGLRVSRIDQAFETIQELGYFDIHLDDPSDGTVIAVGAIDVYPGFIGAANNGNLLVASTNEGLFVVRPDILNMAKMIEDKTVLSERYRYRSILSAEPYTDCLNTIDAESRYIPMVCEKGQ